MIEEMFIHIKVQLMIIKTISHKQIAILNKFNHIKVTKNTKLEIKKTSELRKEKNLNLKKKEIIRVFSMIMINKQMIIFRRRIWKKIYKKRKIPKMTIISMSKKKILMEGKIQLLIWKKVMIKIQWVCLNLKKRKKNRKN